MIDTNITIVTDYSKVSFLTLRKNPIFLTNNSHFTSFLVNINKNINKNGFLLIGILLKFKIVYLNINHGNNNRSHRKHIRRNNCWI